MRGFTLVEVLVAMLIFSVLAAAGVTIMRTSIDSQAAVRGEVERIAAFQRLRANLKADLGQAARRRTRDPEGLTAPAAFTGGDLSSGGLVLAFARRGWENPDAQPRASLQYVEYRIVDGKLERQVRPVLDGAPLGEPQVLYDGVESIRVGFYAGKTWREVWAADELPEVVRLDLRLKGMGEVSQLFLTSEAGA